MLTSRATTTISLVDVVVENDMFTATLLETPATADYLRIGNQVTLLFKETEIALAKDLGGQISLRNRMPVIVQGYRTWRNFKCGRA